MGKEAITATDLLSCATRIETDEGHLMQRSGGHWYAYPKTDPNAPGSGGEVIFEDGTRKLRRFASALEAYTACVEARERVRYAPQPRKTFLSDLKGT